MNNVEKFINELVREGKSINTVLAYRTDIEQFKKWLCNMFGTETDTDSIKKEYIKQYILYMNIYQKRTVNTINRKIKSIVQYIKFLNKTKVSNIIVNITEFKLKNVNNPIKKIDKQDLYKLKRTIYANGNKRDILIYELLMNTAIKCSELININKSDISLTDMKLKNKYSYVDIKASKYIKNRRIELNKDVVTAITEYLEVRPLSEDDILLQGQRGPLTRLAINKILQVYSRQCTIKLVTPNMIRDTSLMEMLESGMDLEIVAKIAGHISRESTSKYDVDVESHVQIK